MVTGTRRTGAAILALLAAGAAAPAARADRSGGVRYGAPAPRAHLGDRMPLRTGMRGHDVRVLQGYLRRLGETVRVDGRFGPATARALRRWERTAAVRADGLLLRWERTAALRADGVLRPGELAVLRAAAAAAVAPAPSGPVATVGPDGLAVPPPGAPPWVVAAIAAGNRIARTPYRWGGGHGGWEDDAYDCSGSVSYALHGGGLLDVPLDSTGLMTWAQPGAGRWISVYANEDHAFAVLAGLRFDTSGRTRAGTRWQPAATRSFAGFTVRHPAGL